MSYNNKVVGNCKDTLHYNTRELRNGYKKKSQTKPKRIVKSLKGLLGAEK